MSSDWKRLEAMVGHQELADPLVVHSHSLQHAVTTTYLAKPTSVISSSITVTSATVTVQLFSAGTTKTQLYTQSEHMWHLAQPGPTLDWLTLVFADMEAIH